MKNIIYIFFMFFLMASCTSELDQNERPFIKQLFEQQREEMLKERVMDFWNTKINKDKIREYDFLDPFFRTAVTKEDFVSKKNPLTYENPFIVGIKIEGNLAFVDVRITYYGEFTGSLKPLKLEKTEGVNNSKWLFMDGNWWMQFEDKIAEHTFARY